MAKLCEIAIKLSLFLVFLARKGYSNENANLTATTTIVNDIQNAFKIITNNSLILNEIIPKMYTIPEITKDSNSLEFIFKIPNVSIPSENNDSKFSVIKMQRSDFMQPIFPNVSRYDMDLQKKKRQMLERLREQNTANVADDSGQDMTDEVSTQNGKENIKSKEDSWTALGLEGWTGDIQPTVRKMKSIWLLRDQERHTSGDDRNSATKSNNNPKSNGLRSPKQQIQQELDASIYIARVNDPFGVSTRWELKNPARTSVQITKAPPPALPKDERSKRDVLELYSMIKCSTGCDPLAYKGYGCYCGFLGAGTPVDGIDRCCKLHDKCYEHSNCLSYLEYFVPYVWKCYRNKPLCALDHGEWGGPTSCAALLCYCDMQLSQCLKKFSCPTRRAVCRSSVARTLQNLFFL